MSTPENAARARAALKAKREAETRTEGTDMFAVIRTADGMYMPVKITMPAGEAFVFERLHEPMPYEALAYHYLANDVTAHYEAGTRSKARDAATLDRANRPAGSVGRG